jgi:hypothetical protein
MQSPPDNPHSPLVALRCHPPPVVRFHPGRRYGLRFPAMTASTPQQHIRSIERFSAVAQLFDMIKIDNAEHRTFDMLRIATPQPALPDNGRSQRLPFRIVVNPSERVWRRFDPRISRVSVW